MENFYIKELPKDCKNCIFGYSNNNCYLDYNIDLIKFEGFNQNEKHKDCPLKSLEEHDKELEKTLETVGAIAKFWFNGYLEKAEEISYLERKLKEIEKEKIECAINELDRTKTLVGVETNCKIVSKDYYYDIIDNQIKRLKEKL